MEDDESDQEYKSRKRDNPHRLMYTNNGSSQENHTRWTPHRRVIACEGQRARTTPRISLVFALVSLSPVFALVSLSPVNAESGNVVGTLVTNRDELPGRIDGEYPWIITER